jgi:hypothetical protein
LFPEKWKTEKEPNSIMLKGEFSEFTKRDFRRRKMDKIRHTRAMIRRHNQPMVAAPDRSRHIKRDGWRHFGAIISIAATTTPTFLIDQR